MQRLGKYRREIRDRGKRGEERRDSQARKRENKQQNA